MTRNRYWFFILSVFGMLFFAAGGISAQTDSVSNNKTIEKCHLFGIGMTNVLDTYLSPENYTGLELRALDEHSRFTNMAHGRISYMSMSMGNISFMDYRDGNGSEIAGMYSFDLGWHYNWMLCGDRLRLQAGCLLDFNIGFIYNTRNSNNPAQAKLNLNLAPSFIATYRLRLCNRPFSLRYMLNIPIAGVMFSPNYGQSYYEIFSEGNYDHNAVVTSLGNAPSLRQMLSCDFNIGRTTLRVGYMNDIQQSRVNNLKYHAWSHLLMIGIVKHFKLIPVQ